MKVLAAMLLSVIMLSSGFMINSPATAAPNENANEKAKVRVPENAVEIAPGIYYIGAVIHDGKLVEGIMAFHHRPGHGGGPGGGGPGGGGNGGGDKCFAFLAKGAAWNNAEDYGVDSSNEAGLRANFIRSTVASSLQEWEDPVGPEIFGGLNTNMVIDGADTSSPDNKNEVLFGDIASPGAIAVTIVWGFFSGPPQLREIVEWDAVFDDVDFEWSDSGEAGKMDFENIAQHELGHAAGMGHPDNSCTEETMYAFASLGETKKRTLNSGDIAGIKSLYS